MARTLRPQKSRTHTVFDESFRPSESSWFVPRWGRSGVYGIFQNTTGKIYVGSAKNMLHRWHCHRSDLLSGIHPNRYLQAAFKKSPASFDFVPIEIVSDHSLLVSREQFWMCFYQSASREHGFNLCPRAYSTLGMKHSDETKKKVGDAFRGRKASPETKSRMSMAAALRMQNPRLRVAAMTGRTGKKNSIESTVKRLETLSKTGSRQIRKTKVVFPNGYCVEFPSVTEAARSTRTNLGSITNSFQSGRENCKGLIFVRL